MKTLRIFISSPDDVAEEREKAKKVIADLERLHRDELTLVPLLWEDLAIPATASFQEGIDSLLLKRHRIDIAVFILWSRLGSPLGNAIRKPDGSPYLSGTEREFDLMLAVFEKSAGKFPVILAYTRSDDEGFSERLDAGQHGDDALEELLRQRKLVKRFIRERFSNEQGHNIRAYHSYHDPVGFAQRLHVHLRGAIDDLLECESTASAWTQAPYRSLEVFDIQHAAIFVGREEETFSLLQRLRDQARAGCAFVCIVGASGSGKSSLARAGVAATLLHHSYDDSVRERRYAVFLPSFGTGELFPAFVRALLDALPEFNECAGGIARFTKSLEEQNLEAAGILIETALNAAAAKLDGSVHLLLLLDQLEELWTDQSLTPTKREEFLCIIKSLACISRCSVVATLRSDFYPQAQNSPAFLGMKGERGHFDLVPPGAAALRELIVQPAHRAGLRFQREESTGRTLDQRILEDSMRDSSTLPLLEYALAELYERRDKAQHLLTFAAYESIGGATGALGRRAAETLGSLPAETAAVLDELLPLLVSMDILGEQNAVRRHAALASLTSTPARQELTSCLVRARLLTTDEQNGTPIATLAHEALLVRWDRAAAWIENNRDLLRVRARLEQYHAMWEGSGRDVSRLLPAGLPVEEGRKIEAVSPPITTKAVLEYVRASIIHHQQRAEREIRLERERRQEAERLRNEAEQAQAEQRGLLIRMSRQALAVAGDASAKGDCRKRIAWLGLALQLDPTSETAAHDLIDSIVSEAPPLNRLGLLPPFTPCLWPRALHGGWRAAGFSRFTPLGPAPSWLQALCEMISGYRFTENSELAPLSAAERSALAERLRNPAREETPWENLRADYFARGPVADRSEKARAPVDSPAWPGLLSFSENDAANFAGRDAEIDLLIESLFAGHILVLYGDSGSGKSSLLRAGLYPELRSFGCIPIEIRLRPDGARSLTQQVYEKLLGTLHPSLSGVPAGNRDSLATDRPYRSPPGLWEAFHDPEYGLVRDEGLNFEGRPVVVFDQFEEIFTLEFDPAARTEFIESLRRLVENRPPVIDEKDAAVAHIRRFCMLSVEPVKVLISIRSDRLHLLEQLAETKRLLLHNKMSLRALSGRQALQVLSRLWTVSDGQSGQSAPFLGPAEAERLVRAIARGGTELPFEDVTVDASILQLVCCEIVRDLEKVMDRGAYRFDDARLESVLGDYYRGKIAAVAAALGCDTDLIAAFIEDDLVTVAGLRMDVPLEQATESLERLGVPRPREAVDRLINQRLLVARSLGEQIRVSLVHDVMCRTVMRSRAERLSHAIAYASWRARAARSFGRIFRRS